MQQIISASKYSIESIFVLVLVQSLSLLPHLTSDKLEWATYMYNLS